MGKKQPEPIIRRGAAAHRRFGAHYRQHYGSVRGLFLRKGFPDEEIRDLVQETFLRAYRGFGGFREESNFLTWIIAIAGNVAINRRRFEHADMRGSPEVAIDGLDDGGEEMLGTESHEPGPTTPEEYTLDNEGERKAAENRRRLRAAMEELPPQMRQCILMYVYQGKKYREIAELLDVKINTVKSQISQAKTRLRALLDELAEEQGSPP